MVINPGGQRPPYEQIADDLRRAIDVGELTPGQPLEPGRVLAERYGVAAMTVQRAIQQLKGEGRLIGVQGRGVFVGGDETDNQDKSPVRRIDHLERTVQSLLERVDKLERDD